MNAGRPGIVLKAIQLTKLIKTRQSVYRVRMGDMHLQLLSLFLVVPRVGLNMTHELRAVQARVDSWD